MPGERARGGNHPVLHIPYDGDESQEIKQVMNQNSRSLACGNCSKFATTLSGSGDTETLPVENAVENMWTFVETFNSLLDCAERGRRFSTDSALFSTAFSTPLGRFYTELSTAGSQVEVGRFIFCPPTMDWPETVWGVTTAPSPGRRHPVPAPGFCESWRSRSPGPWWGP